MQFGSNRLTVALRTNCNNDGTTDLQTLCRRSWIKLGKIGHGCGLSHPASEPTRLPRGVTDRVAPRSHDFRWQTSVGLRNIRAMMPDSNHRPVTGVTPRRSSLGITRRFASIKLGARLCDGLKLPIRTSSAWRSTGYRKTSCCYARTRGPCASCPGPLDSCR